MYVYREVREDGPRFFQVGFFGPDTSDVLGGNNGWISDSDHPTREDARVQVNYLNGGAAYEMVTIRALDNIAEKVENITKLIDGKFVKQYGG